MASPNSENRKLRAINLMDRERKAGTRVIHGPEDCPVARINGCEPCMMEAFGALCEARKKAEQ